MSEHAHPNRANTTTTAALSEARERLSEIVEEVAMTGGEFLITKHGRPMAVLLASDEYESLIETLNILSDSDAMAAIREAEDDLASGELINLD
jgi:antitoxin YefM